MGNDGFMTEQTKRNGKDTNKKATRPKSTAREYVEAFAVALLAALLIRTFVVQAFRIPTGSMEDTLLVGDFLLVNKFIYGAHIPFTDWTLPAFKEPKPGDVVVFKYPRNPDQDYIKRCIAVGGQTVEIRDKVVYVDGRKFEEPPHLKHIDSHIKPEGVTEYDVEPRGAGNRDNYGPVRVPEGHLFMMGDNRDNSLDSRYWGFLPRENVIGEALIIYFSWDTVKPLYKLLTKIRWTRIGNLISFLECSDDGRAIPPGTGGTRAACVTSV